MPKLTYWETALRDQFEGEFSKFDSRWKAVKEFVQRICISYGACDHCYGKGYSTQLLAGKKTFSQDIHFCQCERGKDLQRLLKK
jgi:hypothetical protein